MNTGPIGTISLLSGGDMTHALMATLDLLNLFHFVLAVCTSLWGLALILRRGQTRSLRYFGSLLILLAANLLLLYLSKSKIFARIPLLPGAQFLAMSLLGPSCYLFARSVSDGWKPTPLHALHLILVLIAIAICVSTYLLNSEAIIKSVEVWNRTTRAFEWSLHSTRIGILIIVGYFLLGLGVLCRGGIPARRPLILLATATPALVLLVHGHWHADLQLQETGFLYLEAHVLTFYILTNRERNWLNMRRPETTQPARAHCSSRARDAKKPEDHLRNLDKTAVLRQLDRIMIDEKRFADEDLNFDRLASLLGIKRHQLSGLLNHVIGLDFHAYINRFRIQEAQTLLLAEPERSVLSVAFAAGFSSKSSFHQVFRKHTGVTPTEFRQRASLTTLQSSKAKTVLAAGP